MDVHNNTDKLWLAPHMANFMAGHKPALYNDMKSRGPEFLREK